MYKANLSHRVTGDYLAHLTRTGLIEVRAESERGATYMTTRKGARFLSSFRAMKNLLDEKLIVA